MRKKSRGATILFSNFLYFLLQLYYLLYRWEIKIPILDVMKKDYKRKYRELSTRTREKISRAMKGKKRSDKTKMLISQSMKNYWLGVESKNNDVKPLIKNEQ